MPSNVELARTKISPLKQDPATDVYTQKPRTPNYPRRCRVNDQRTLVSPNPSSFFSTISTNTFDKRFATDRYTATISRHNLCGNSNDLQLITDRWSRTPAREYSGSIVGAYFPWPPNKAGEKVQEHFTCNAPEKRFNAELTGRPPTNLPGQVRMAFGRAAPGYYAKRFPNNQTWSGSNVLQGRDCASLYSLPKRTWAEYDVWQQEQREKLAGLPETTVYQDHYLAHLPTNGDKVTPRTLRMQQVKCPSI